MRSNALIEIAVEVDGEAAEAVAELSNRYNGGDWTEDSEADEASGGVAVLESSGYDDCGRSSPRDRRTPDYRDLPGPIAFRLPRRTNRSTRFSCCSPLVVRNERAQRGGQKLTQARTVLLAGSLPVSCL